MKKNFNIKVYADGKSISRDLRILFNYKNFNIDVTENNNKHSNTFIDENADIIIHDFESEIEDPAAKIPELIKKNTVNSPHIFIFPKLTSELKQILESEYPQTDYFVKPIDKNDLLAKIKLLFERNSMKVKDNNSLVINDTNLDFQMELKSIIEKFPGGVIYIFDRDYNYKAVFGSGISKLKIDRDELLDKSLKDLYPEEIYEYLIENCKSVWKGERVEFEFTFENESYFVSAFPINSTDNGIDKIIAVIQNISDSKNDRSNLDESEELYKTIFEQSSDPILILENETFVECNDVSIEFLGYKNKDELCGKTPYELSPKVQPDGMLSKLKASQIIKETQKKGKARFEWVHQKKNGEIVWCDVSLTKIRINQKDRIYTIWRDITESKNAQADLNKSEKKYRSIFENSVMGIFRSTPEGQYKDVNLAFANIFGFDSPESMLNEVENIETLYVNKFHRNKLLELLTHQGMVENFEAELYHREGHTIWISINAILTSDDEGNTFFEGTVQNITKRKIAQKSLRESNAHLQAIIESPKNVFIFSTDKNLKYTLFNSQYEKVVKKLWNTEVKTGEYILDTINNSKLKKNIIQSCERALEGEIFDEIKKLPDHDIYYHYYWSPIKVENGMINGVTCIAIDITSQKRIEEKLNRNMVDLEKFNNLMVGRELKMIELKNEINQLRKVAGLANKYSTPDK